MFQCFMLYDTSLCYSLLCKIIIYNKQTDLWLDLIMKQEKLDTNAKYVLGIEGSANKIGIGIVDFEGKIYANPR